MNKDILNYIKTLSNNEKIQELLIETVGKIILKQDNIENFIKENEIIHIRDWIYSIVENNEQWKIPRVLTLDALYNMADKYFEKKNNKIQTIELNEIDEKMIADLGDYYVVQMLTSEALDNESKIMQHCIGYGGYDQNLKNDKYKYFSLRDKFNKAHVTLEIYKKEILQLQGKQNKIPELKYLEKLLPWLVENKYNINTSEYGFVFNKNDNKTYPIDKIPDNCDIMGDLILYGKMNIVKLPDNLTVNGNLDLSKTRINELPNNLTVNGDISLMKTMLKNIPKSVNVKGSFHLEESLIEEIPNGIVINGNLKLDFCKEIKKLPEGLIVNGNLSLCSCENIEELPKGLKVSGEVDLSYSGIKNINNLTKYNLDLLLKNSNIEELPDNLIVEGNLNLEDCKNIKILPKGLNVLSDLVLYKTNIKEIPSDTKVGEFLDILFSNVNILPNNLKCPEILIGEQQVDLIKETMEFNFISVDLKRYERKKFFEKIKNNEFEIKI